MICPRCKGTGWVETGRLLDLKTRLPDSDVWFCPDVAIPETRKCVMCSSTGIFVPREQAGLTR